MKIRNIAVLMLGACLASCVKDDTSLGTGVISEITIQEGSVKEEYSIFKNEVLEITPTIKQSSSNKPLTYTWEIDQKVYSYGRVFKYTGERLGKYQCRLIVANEDGKAFFPFMLYVETPYEEGITVLSHDKDGKSMLSFMLAQKDPAAEQFVEGDCFVVNNPEEIFADSVSDMVQCDGSLIIACKGNNKTSKPGTIYYLNEKTFVLENKLTTQEYPDFKPTHLGIPANGSLGVAYPILSENGKVYEFSTTEGVLAPAVRFQSTYAQSLLVTSGGMAGKYTLHLWDKKQHNGALAMLMDGYGPYFCSKVYQPSDSDGFSEDDNYFNGKELVAMFVPRLAQGSTESENIVVITRTSERNFQKAELYKYFWKYNEEEGKTVLDVGKTGVAGSGAQMFDEKTPMIASRVFQVLLFAQGNKVYSWNYLLKDLFQRSKVIASVGSEDAVITSFELSKNHKETYVAYYEPNEEGMNGYVAVINTDTGELLRQYDNVCYQPVKIMYKKK